MKKLQNYVMHVILKFMELIQILIISTKIVMNMTILED